MSARLWMLWVATRDSLWFIPATMTLMAAALAVLIVELERSDHFDPGSADHWLLGGGAEGAQQMLSTIAGGLITVTGVVFSVTTVALQLASSQFTPRVLRNFTSDRANQVVLGVFISTFTYTLLVLRVVRSSDSDNEAFVPRVAILGSVTLFLISIGFLIYYINHAARSMQIAFILDQVTRRTLEQVKLHYPETIGLGSDRLPLTDRPASQGACILPARAGYLQAIDEQTLLALGQRQGLLIRMERRIGDFVLPNQGIASVWPAEAADEATVEAIRRGFVLGLERTPEQDVEFGIIEIADIAVKALSPAINDPTTAIHCIDRLAEIISLLAARSRPGNVPAHQGTLHFQALHPEFMNAVELAFFQIHHYGSSNPVINHKLLTTLEHLVESAPETRREPLRVFASKLRAARAK